LGKENMGRQTVTGKTAKMQEDEAAYVSPPKAED